MCCTTDIECYFGEIINFIVTLNLRLLEFIMLGKEQE